MKTDGTLMRDVRVPVYDSSALKIPLVSQFAELFRYRFLVWNLITRDLKVRYKRSSIGFIWVMLNPLLTMAVLTIVFQHVIRVQTPHYPVYVLAGLLLWNLFAQSTVAAMPNLTSNASVLRRMYVPPSVFVASTIGSAVVNLLFAIVPFVALALVSGVYPNLAWFFIIVPMVQVTLFSFGVALTVSAMVVFFQDIYEMYSVFILLFMYITPIIYPASALANYAEYEKFNPMFQFLEAFRKPILDGTLPPTDHILLATGLAVGTMLIGWLIFTRLENKFVYHF